MSATHNELLVNTFPQQKDNASLVKRVDKMDAFVSEEKIRKLKCSINELDQYGKLLNFGVNGLKEYQNEGHRVCSGNEWRGDTK